MDALILSHACFKIDGDVAARSVVSGDIGLSLMSIFVGVRW